MKKSTLGLLMGILAITGSIQVRADESSDGARMRLPDFKITSSWYGTSSHGETRLVIYDVYKNLAVLVTAKSSLLCLGQHQVKGRIPQAGASNRAINLGGIAHRPYKKMLFNYGYKYIELDTLHCELK